MSIHVGSKVIGKKYEFKGITGIVIRQPYENFFIVNFEGCRIPVLITRDNLLEVKDDYLC